MNFLERLGTLAQENDKVEIVCAFTIEKGMTVVTVVPKTKGKTFTPFIMRGKPEELDQEFETHFENLQAALGLITNAYHYAESIKNEIEADKKEADSKKPAAKSTPTPAAKPAATQPKKEEKKAAPAKAAPPKVEEEESDEAFELFGDE